MDEKRGVRAALREGLLEGETRLAVIFDVFLTTALIVSLVAVLLETIPSIRAGYDAPLMTIEWVFTIIFTFEYVLRVFSALRPIGYVFSVIGIVDFVSVLPLYINMVIPGAYELQFIRLLRLVRAGSRLFRLSHSLNRVSEFIFHVRHHLGTNEQITLFFRPSRRTYLFSYLFTTFAFVLSLLLISTNPAETLVLRLPVLIILGYVMLVISFGFLLRLEIKIWSTRYAITNERLFYSTGILGEEFKSLTYTYVTDVLLVQSFWNRILNTGTLVIQSAAGETSKLMLENIANPLAIKKSINEHVAAVSHGRK